MDMEKFDKIEMADEGLSVLDTLTANNQKDEYTDRLERIHLELHELELQLSAFTAGTKEVLNTCESTAKAVCHKLGVLLSKDFDGHLQRVADKMSQNIAISISDGGKQMVSNLSKEGDSIVTGIKGQHKELIREMKSAGHQIVEEIREARGKISMPIGFFIGLLTTLIRLFGFLIFIMAFNLDRWHNKEISSMIICFWIAYSLLMAGIAYVSVRTPKSRY